jgi:hypothetical protein
MRQVSLRRHELLRAGTVGAALSVGAAFGCNAILGNLAVPDGGIFPIWFYQQPPMGLSEDWVANWLAFR